MRSRGVLLRVWRYGMLGLRQRLARAPGRRHGASEGPGERWLRLGAVHGVRVRDRDRAGGDAPVRRERPAFVHRGRRPVPPTVRGRSVKIFVPWLRDLCPTELDAEDLAEVLTSKGAEVESIDRPWRGLSGVVVALDVEVTPNRGDLLSVIGVAREVAAATGTPLVAPNVRVDEADESVEGVATIEIHDLDRCPRYRARILRDVRHITAPIAAQARLAASGMRPISAAVDATNYAMLEIGQPLHPFDLSLLKGPGIVVRRARQGERMITLDDVERTFTDDDLLICDAERPVGVGGVMGGELAEISPSTTDVLLEAASFQREGIQRTRRRLALSTEASTRFERGVDPEAVVTGGDRACRLMVEWCDASVLRGALDVGDAPRRRWVSMRASRSSAIIGYEVSVSDAEAVFDRLGMAHERAEEDTIRVEAPGYRFDLELEVDLIEEVVRVQGYDRVGSTLPAIRQPGGVPERYAFVDRIRRAMASAGLREVRPMPFLSDKELRLFGEGDAVRITNPLQGDDGLLRTQLFGGLLRVARRNTHRQVRQG